MIVRLNKNDWKSIQQIYIAGIQTGHATFQEASEVENWTFEDWAKSKISDSILGFKEEGIVKAWAALSGVSNRCVYSGVAEVSIYVAPSAAGKGIGFRLFSALIDYAENNKVWTIEAGIFPENKASIRLHEKCGFRIVGVREKLGQQNGIWRDVLLMERRSTAII